MKTSSPPESLRVPYLPDIERASIYEYGGRSDVANALHSIHSHCLSILALGWSSIQQLQLAYGDSYMLCTENHHQQPPHIIQYPPISINGGLDRGQDSEDAVNARCGTTATASRSHHSSSFYDQHLINLALRVAILQTLPCTNPCLVHFKLK